jgi:hypothetical protein
MGSGSPLAVPAIVCFSAIVPILTATRLGSYSAGPSYNPTVGKQTTCLSAATPRETAMASTPLTGLDP